MPMITAFNRQQLAAVRGMRKQSEIRAILGIHGIEYKLEVVRDGGPAVKLADGSILAPLSLKIKEVRREFS